MPTPHTRATIPLLTIAITTLTITPIAGADIDDLIDPALTAATSVDPTTGIDPADLGDLALPAADTTPDLDGLDTLPAADIALPDTLATPPVDNLGDPADTITTDTDTPPTLSYSCGAGLICGGDSSIYDRGYPYDYVSDSWTDLKWLIDPIGSLFQLLYALIMAPINFLWGFLHNLGLY